MSGKSRILYVVNALETDAPTQLTAAVAKAARQAGWLVMVVAWSRGGALQDELERVGIKTQVLGRGMVRNAVALNYIVREFKPDLVHTILVRPMLGYALSRFLYNPCRPKWLTGDHGVHEWHERGPVTGWLMERILPSVLTLVDRVVTVSGPAKGELVSRGVAASQVCVVPNGVDVRRFYPGSRAERSHLVERLFPGQKPEEVQFLVGSAGNLRRVKGYDVLLDTLPLILDAVPTTRFVIWGEGPELTDLKMQAARLGGEHAVAFAGYEKSLAERLSLLDVYVQPSRAESFGMGTAEAMACGLPVVVSDVGGLGELVEQNVSGRKSNAGNSAALAEDVIQLLRARPLAEKMGSAARLRILGRYTQQGMTSAMLACYEQLLQRREAQCEQH